MAKTRCYVILLLTITVLMPGLVLADGSVYIADYELITANDYLELYLNKDTTEVAVKDKGSGQFWYTNPPKRDKLETRAGEFNKEMLAAQLRISFFAPGDMYMQWDNKHESVDYKQFSISEIPQGVRVDYTLGKEWALTDYIPVMASKDFFENEILSNLDEDDRKFTRDKFWFCTLVKKEKNLENYTFTDVSARIEEKDLFKNYRIKMLLGNGEEIDLTAHGSENGFPAFMKENALKYILGKVVEGKKYMFISELTYEDLNVLQDPFYIQIENMFNFDKKKLAQLFKSIGLSPESIVEEHTKYKIAIPYKNIRVFKVPLEYRLDGKDLIVKVPIEDVEYPKNVLEPIDKTRVTMPLVDIDLLPFFGAGSQEDEGYIFVPDGSGALINFNNGKVELPEYHKFVYDRDKSLEEVKRKPTISAPVRLPVFGIKENDTGFLGIIENGGSLADIRAKVANTINSYNAVYSKFKIIPYTNMQLVGVMDKGSSVNIYQSRKTNSDIIIRYKLLSDDQANYSGMANVYRSYLKEKMNWQKIVNENKLPFLLEVMGSYHKTMPQFGFPTRTVIPLTTFAETKNLISELKLKGIENIDIIYNGWLEGGIKHIYPQKPSVEGKLGGKKGFEELSQYLKEREIDFYPEVNFLQVDLDRLLDGFNWFWHTAQYLEGGQAKQYSYNQATYRWEEEKFSYLLSTRYLDRLVDDFINDYKRLNTGGLSLRYLGQEYYSDFQKNPEELIDREKTVGIIQEQIEKIHEQVPSIMVRGGNLPALFRSNYVVEAPMYGGADNLIDRGIPFYQMVLHGYLKYSGEPINLTGDRRREFLKIIETGAIPYFRGSYQRSDLLKQSGFNENYSLYYQDWLNQAGEFYKEANNVLRELQNQIIINHSQVKENVYQSVYENGHIVVVNYGADPIEIKNKIIEGNSYQLFRGEG